MQSKHIIATAAVISLATLTSLSFIRPTSQANEAAPDQTVPAETAPAEIDPAETAPAAECMPEAEEDIFQKRKELVNTLLQDQLYEDAITLAQDIALDDTTPENIRLVLSCNQAITELLNSRMKLTRPCNLVWTAAKRQALEGIKYPQQNIDTVRANIKLYDVQMTTLLTLEELLSDTVRRVDDKDLRDLYKQVTTLKMEVAERRTCYLSYDVLSPYFAESYRIACLARGFWNDDEEELYRAGFWMAQAMPDPSWLNEASGDVKRQFCKVSRYVRENLNSREWEELKMEASLAPDGKSAWIERINQQRVLHAGNKH